MPGKRGPSKSAKLLPRNRSKSPSGKKSGKRKSKSATTAKQSEIDILSQPAMENLYYIAHSAVDALEMRGFGWEGASKKKGKKGKKKKKKK